jgi:Flp pilus assembly pilin Flp
MSRLVSSDEGESVIARSRNNNPWPQDHLANQQRRGHTPMKKMFMNFVKDEQGQDLIEYTLLMAFIALASAAIFVNAGKSVSSIWGSASTQLSNAAISAS